MTAILRVPETESAVGSGTGVFLAIDATHGRDARDHGICMSQQSEGPAYSRGEELTVPPYFRLDSPAA